MVDFPDAPSEGDTHEEEGTVWVYRDPPGAWVVVTGDAGDPVTIVDSGVPDGEGWQVWGDTLIQWGTAPSTDGNGDTTITLAQPFKNSIYRIMGNVGVGAGAAGPDRTVNTGVLTATTAGLKVSVNGGASAGVGCHFIAVGEAPDDLKQPKTVQTVGGSELQEHHDPTGFASFRVVGNTLECWGAYYTGSAGVSVSFPKTFANEFPRVTLAVQDSAAMIPTYQSLSSSGMYGQSWDTSGTHTAGSVSYHVIGEWDGT